MVYKLEIGDNLTISFSSKDEIISFLLREKNQSSGEQLKLIYPNGSYYFYEGLDIDWSR